MNTIMAKIFCSFVRNNEKRQNIYDILTHTKHHLHSHSVAKYIVVGENNKIIVVEKNKERILSDNEILPGLMCHIYGNNNIIKLHLPLKSANSSINIGDPELHNDDAYIEIGTSDCWRNVHIFCGRGNAQKCKIGNGTTSYGLVIHLGEQSQCLIGEDCMFSNSISIWGSDGHAIFDKTTNEILNRTSDGVIIGDHCWIGEGVKLTKNAVVQSYSVIGINSVVCKKFNEEHIVLGGVPAKIIRRNVEWIRENPYLYLRKRDDKKLDESKP